MTSKPDIKISSARAGEMIADFTDLPVLRYPMLPYLPRVLELRDNYPAYDGFYVALAESLDMPLLTDDRKYAKAAGSTATIETWP